MTPGIEPFLILGVALAAGLLIGLEREQSRGGAHDVEPGNKGKILGGVRTHPLFSLGGAIAALLAKNYGVWILAAAFVCFGGFVLIAFADDRRLGRDQGITSEAAFLMSFLLGALAASDAIEPVERRMMVVASLATAVTLLLSTKELLHRWVEKMSRGDIVATIKFLIVAVIMLPLLPDKTYGPFDVLNPYKIGLMITLIAGISFVGYVLIRVLGAGRGLAITGLVAGLASSTAVTLTFSGRARESPDIAPACALAVQLASTVMCVRILVIVAVINAPLVVPLLLPLGAMTVAGIAASIWLYFASRKRREKAGEVEMKNPFELSTAIKLGILYGVVLFVSKAATETFGDAGTYLAGLLAGLTDVDAITLSMANLSKGGIDLAVAATTIMIGAAANTVVKAVMAMVLGRGKFAALIGISFGLTIVAGAIGVFVLRI